MKFVYQKKVYREVLEICDPLFNFFKINFFSHTRAFHDGTFASLMTNPELTEYYISQKYPIRFSNGSGIYLESGYYSEFHLNDESSNQIILDLQTKFNTAHFFYIIDKKKNYDDMYAFSASQENKMVLNLYLNNLDLINQFLLYYQEKSNSLIKKCNLISYDKEYFCIANQVNYNNVGNRPCFDNMLLNKIKLTGNNGEVIISKREFDCLKLIIKSHSFKEIGKILNISPRTVETYINNLKYKLGCETRAQVIELIISLNKEFMIYFLNKNAI